MRLLALFAVGAACALPGEWPHTRDADWLVHVSTRRVAGVRVHIDRLRAVWRAGRRNVWIQAGPTTRDLPAPSRWRRLVAASLARPPSG
jgi:hypothetical protein